MVLPTSRDCAFSQQEPRLKESGPPVRRLTSARGGLSSHSVKLVDDYIRANLSGEMTLQDLAAVAGLSKRHFHRAFQDSFGTTPHRYILSLRIEDAKLRLSQTGSSVTEIALTVGFGQPEHFSTTFKKYTGYTPSQFRGRRII